MCESEPDLDFSPHQHQQKRNLESPKHTTLFGQVRFKDLFRKYDVDGSGQLSAKELKLLVRDIMPNKVTDAQIWLFLASEI